MESAVNKNAPRPEPRGIICHFERHRLVSITVGRFHLQHEGAVLQPPHCGAGTMIFLATIVQT